MSLLEELLSGEATVSGWFLLLLVVLGALAGVLVTAGLQEDRVEPPGPQRPTERPIRARQRMTPATGIRPPARPRRPRHVPAAPRSTPPRIADHPPRLAWIWEGWAGAPLPAGWMPRPRID